MTMHLVISLHSTAENNSMANLASKVNKVTSVHSDSTGTEELNIYNINVNLFKSGLRKGAVTLATFQ